VKLRGSLMKILRHGISSLNIPISRPPPSDRAISYSWPAWLPLPAPATQILPQELVRRPASQAPLRSKPRRRLFVRRHRAMKTLTHRKLRSTLLDDPIAWRSPYLCLACFRPAGMPTRTAAPSRLYIRIPPNWYTTTTMITTTAEQQQQDKNQQ